MLRLVSSDRPALEITRDSVVVGRDAGTDVVVDDKSVSRRHARFTRGAQGWTVEDLGSGNGTWIDGQRISAAPLAAGQELKLGTTAWRVETPGEAEGATLLVPALAGVAPSQAHVPGPPPLPGAPPPAPSTDPYGGYGQQAAPYQQPYAPQPYAQAQPSSGGSSGLLKLGGFALVAWLLYSQFGGKKEAAAPAGPPPAGQQQPAGSGIKIQSMDVQKGRDPDGTIKVLVRTIVVGFGAKPAQGGYQIAVAQDFETVTAEGERIDALSKNDLNVLEKVVDSNEGLNATLDYTITAKPDTQASIICRTRVRDKIAGGQATSEVRVQIP